MGDSRLPLVLASTSRFRRELLARLGLPVEVAAPDYDEAGAAGPTPRVLALVRARGKAASVAPRYPGRLVVGSDQVAELDGCALGKPGGRDAAIEQLLRMAGRWVGFHTAVVLMGPGVQEEAVETFRVRLRRLSRPEVEFYVDAEEPFESAGSFRIEGLGIALMEELEGRDFSALIGLPLIALTGMLSRADAPVLGGPGQGRQQ